MLVMAEDRQPSGVQPGQRVWLVTDPSAGELLSTTYGIVTVSAYADTHGAGPEPEDMVHVSWKQGGSRWENPADLVAIEPPAPTVRLTF